MDLRKLVIMGICLLGFMMPLVTGEPVTTVAIFGFIVFGCVLITFKVLDTVVGGGGTDAQIGNSSDFQVIEHHSVFAWNTTGDPTWLLWFFLVIIWGTCTVMCLLCCPCLAKRCIKWTVPRVDKGSTGSRNRYRSKSGSITSTKAQLDNLQAEMNNLSRSLQSLPVSTSVTSPPPPMMRVQSDTNLRGFLNPRNPRDNLELPLHLQFLGSQAHLVYPVHRFGT